VLAMRGMHVCAHVCVARRESCMLENEIARYA
jgi:hypothetical protein